mmetsp:Transcript_37211/g.92012  ORF Transcript_37211/g.92012 Transcript_37211/m.92012 type:complete len:211 (-) Transcript_37211:127-759(-)
MPVMALSCSLTSPMFCFLAMLSAKARLTHGALLDTSGRVKSWRSKRSSSSRMRARNASPTMSEGAPHSTARPHARSLRSSPLLIPRSSTYRLMCSKFVAVPPGSSATGCTICMRDAMSIMRSSICLPLCFSSCRLKKDFWSSELPTLCALRKWSFSVSRKHSISCPSGMAMVSSSRGMEASQGMYTYLKLVRGVAIFVWIECGFRVMSEC